VRYIPHTDADVRRMLDAIGASSLDELFAAIPDKHRLARPLDLPAAIGEQELLEELGRRAERNAHAGAYAWFLGAGVYPHFAPSAVDALVSRGEFTTAYTPYQAEISQGTLQAIFEWQTMIAELTGCEVANASMYDGASATAEAALMAMRVTRRSRVVMASALHPHYREVVRTYLDGLQAELVEAPRGADGRTAGLADAVDEATACVIVQQPNFFGCVEDLAAAAAAAHARGALLVVSVNEALSLALLAPPGARGADIACGEAQSFGVPMGLGGPHLGFMATGKTLVRQLPGRLVGQTLDAAGRRGFVLTLSTRVPHIRRERATSNICTNQGLCL
jgi:glycine dehydrogenase subunit 1